MPKEKLHRLPFETALDASKRFERERELIAKARAQILDGRYIADDDVDPWLDQMVDGNAPLPMPNGIARPLTAK